MSALFARPFRGARGLRGIRGVRPALPCCAAVLVLGLLARGPKPALLYTITLDPTDLSGYRVELEIRHAPDTLLLAMAHHPEYDDRPWRSVRDLNVTGGRGPVEAVRLDSALWRAVLPGGEATVRYRVALGPPSGAPRRSWRPFLRSTGALLGGIQSFLYVVGAEDAPAHVVLSGLPEGWRVATGLEATADPGTWYAASVARLLDSPILMGPLRSWRFAIDGVPHRVVYWPLPDAAPFDTTAFVDVVRRIAEAAVAVFGAPPYREYTFLFQDGAGDALEHANSVTIGAPSASLARDPAALALETAHEYFHTWNLVRLRPAGRGGVSYRPPPRTRGLWWSEGVTMYYAGALLRRSGLRDEAAARAALAGTIAAYLGNPGNVRTSPERASWTADDPVPAGGRYRASYYTQGALIGEVLDIAIRDSTRGERGLDDVMRALMDRFADQGEGGFTTADIERAAGRACRCDLRRFFAEHVRGARQLALDAPLADLGLRAVVTRPEARDSAGRALPDLRVWAYVPEDSTGVRLSIWDPASAWGRSGLRPDDEVLAVNGIPVATGDEFRAALAGARAGDTVLVRYRRAGAVARARVVVSSYRMVHVELEDLPAPTPLQRARRLRWLRG